MLWFAKNMPVTFGSSAPQMLEYSGTDRQFENEDPLKVAAQRWPSDHPVYAVPESMKAPRFWVHARAEVGTVVAVPAVDPSKLRFVTTSLADRVAALPQV